MEKWRLSDEELQRTLPLGVKLVRTLRGHTGKIGRISWSPDGRMLASPSNDKTIRLWDAEIGECLRTIETGFNEIGPRIWQNEVVCVAFDPQSRTVAYPYTNHTVQLLELDSGKICRHFNWSGSKIWSIAISPDGEKLAIAGNESASEIYNIHSGQRICKLEDQTFSTHVAFDPFNNSLVSIGEVRDDTHWDRDDPESSWTEEGNEDIMMWDPDTGELNYMLVGHKQDIFHVDFNPLGKMIASASMDKTIKLWDHDHGLIHTFEGHTSSTTCVSFLENGRLLASKSADGFRIWKTDSGECVAIITDPIPEPLLYTPSLAFHPHLPLLANVGSDPGGKEYVIHIYELDLDILLSQSVVPTVTYTSAKIVLVGDSGVGKTGLGWRLAHGEFKEHSSTHGQHFWLLKQLCKQRQDGAQCEALLWDLAGQPVYRLTHALFLEDVDLALILFDSASYDNPLSGVEFWLKQLKVKSQPPNGTLAILIAARSDRGTPCLMQEELNTFCEQNGIKAYLLTSAKSGEGIEKLTQWMHNIIPWDEKPATITTKTFKRIKDFVLDLKEKSGNQDVILTPNELRKRLERTDSKWQFSDEEMMTSVGHLENHGFVKWLKTSQGEPYVLLNPELLNNLAASFVLEARQNQKGLGSLEEQRLLSGEYKFPELENLFKDEKDLLLNSTIKLFLKHNVCFREADQVSACDYLVFPSLINLKKPLIEDGIQIEDDVAYIVSGIVENVYASLVVLMGYTQYFTRTNQWQNNARYEAREGFVCGFRLEDERAEELDFIMYFHIDTPDHVRNLFQSLFEYYLARKNLKMIRYGQVKCSNGHMLNHADVRKKISSFGEFIFCNDCGEKIKLPKTHQPISLSKRQPKEVEDCRLEADKRTKFEQVLFSLKSHVIDKGISSPKCFISYAWGIPSQEHWVEHSLVADLQKAGFDVVFDKWHNLPASSFGRYIDRMEKADCIIVIGTNAYRQKYDNEDPEKGTVVAAECAYINARMRGPEKKKETIIPVLLEGTAESSFPPCLCDRVFWDFRKHNAYFGTVLELLLSLYDLKPNDTIAIELRILLMDERTQNSYQIR